MGGKENAGQAKAPLRAANRRPKGLATGVRRACPEQGRAMNRRAAYETRASWTPSGRMEHLFANIVGNKKEKGLRDSACRISHCASGKPTIFAIWKKSAGFRHALFPARRGSLKQESGMAFGPCQASHSGGIINCFEERAAFFKGRLCLGMSVFPVRSGGNCAS